MHNISFCNALSGGARLRFSRECPCRINKCSYAAAAAAGVRSRGGRDAVLLGSLLSRRSLTDGPDDVTTAREGGAREEGTERERIVHSRDSQLSTWVLRRSIPCTVHTQLRGAQGFLRERDGCAAAKVFTAVRIGRRLKRASVEDISVAKYSMCVRRVIYGIK